MKKTDKLNCTSRDTIKRVQIQATERKEIFATYTFNHGLVSRHVQISKKSTEKQAAKWEKGMNCLSL